MSAQSFAFMASSISEVSELLAEYLATESLYNTRVRLAVDRITTEATIGIQMAIVVEAGSSCPTEAELVLIHMVSRLQENHSQRNYQDTIVAACSATEAEP